MPLGRQPVVCQNSLFRSLSSIKVLAFRSRSIPPKRQFVINQSSLSLSSKSWDLGPSQCYQEDNLLSITALSLSLSLSLSLIKVLGFRSQSVLPRRQPIVNQNSLFHQSPGIYVPGSATKKTTCCQSQLSLSLSTKKTSLGTTWGTTWHQTNSLSHQPPGI